MSPAELPSTIEACHALIEQQAEMNQQQAAVIEEQQELLRQMQDDNKLLKRALFGNRRERFTDDPDQLYLFTSMEVPNEDDSAKNGNEPEADETVDGDTSQRRSRGRGRRGAPP